MQPQLRSDAGSWQPAAVRALLALLGSAALLALLLGLLPGGGVRSAHAAPPAAPPAQDAAGSYTVQPGDTLGVIAQRFGVSLESLIAINGIADPNLLRVGQLLVIPGAAGVQGNLAGVPTAAVRALPGETLAAVAARVGQDPLMLSALNNLSTTARLFPGEPVRVPLEAAPDEPLRFGAITAIGLPGSIAQGRTARMVVESSRPLALSANWNGLPLPFAPLDVITRQIALLPAPALLGPGVFPLELSYATSSGVPVTRTFSLAVVDGGYARQVIVVPSDRQDFLAPENVVNEEAKVSAALSGFTPDLVPRATFLRPIALGYETTSPFGTRRFYDSGPHSYEGYHAGQDFGAGVGVTVTAPALGIVTLAELLGTRGNAVILDHGRGVFTGYWHLSELKVVPGQVVSPGEPLGLVGNTGLSTGAHLHWEMRIYGIAVDPMQFLNEAPFPPPDG